MRLLTVFRLSVAAAAAMLTAAPGLALPDHPWRRLILHPLWLQSEPLSALASALASGGIIMLWARRWRQRYEAETERLALKAGELAEAHREVSRALRRAQEAESMQQAHNDVLELVARDRGLENVLLRMALAIEQHCCGVSCSIQLCPPGGKRLNASPSLPPEWQQSLAAIPIPDFCAAGQHALADLSPHQAWIGPVSSAKAGQLQRFYMVPIEGDSQPIGAIIAFVGGELCLRQSEQSFLDATAKLAALAADRRVLYDQLSHRAEHDELTGLNNRASLTIKLTQDIAASASAGTMVGVVYLDLDNFKSINDSFGHRAGDAVLREVAGRLRACTRRSDTVARLGGDEFAVVLPGLRTLTDAERIAAHLAASLSQAILFSGSKLMVGGSAGISLYPADGQDPESLLQAADSRMYQEKAQRRHGEPATCPPLPALAVTPPPP